jgi:hypothetical protein
MANEVEVFGSTPPARQAETAMVVAQSRASKEVEAAMIVAKKFPRDQNQAYTRIMQACKRRSLAEVSQYAYPRGGQTVTGPSIRLAETLAREWGNMTFGISELEQANGESTIEAYCWDMETNTRRATTFQVPHKRYTKNGSYPLVDPRDIYELVANNGARRLRACILAVIPGDVVDAAVEACNGTLANAVGSEPLQDRVRKMIVAFADMGVSQDMLATRLQHPMEAVIEAEMVGLRKIYASIKDGFSKREDWFGLPAAKSGVEGLVEKMKGGQQNPADDIPMDPAPATTFFNASQERQRLAVEALDPQPATVPLETSPSPSPLTQDGQTVPKRGPGQPRKKTQPAPEAVPPAKTPVERAQLAAQNHLPPAGKSAKALHAQTEALVSTPPAISSQPAMFDDRLQPAVVDPDNESEPSDEEIVRSYEERAAAEFTQE